METIGKIRRRRLVLGESISAIARDLGLSRNTVKRALRSEGEGFEYRRSSQPRPKLGPFLETLEAWLEGEEKLPAREQRTAQRIYEALCLEGYTGAVDTVRRQMRAFERRRHSVVGAFIPQYFAPGEAYQFDFSHEHVELGGIDQVVKLAHVRLCHSRAFFLVAYPRESQEMVFDAHARAFAFFGGVPRRGIYDNLKPAVDAIFTGKERRYNRRFLVMCNHYLIDPTACTRRPRDGRKARSRTRSATCASGCSRRSSNARIWLSSMRTWRRAACSWRANATIQSKPAARSSRCGRRNVRRCVQCRLPSTAMPRTVGASPRRVW
jgi:transposase